MHEVALRGCQPEPLGSYLRALAVLRLVVEQRDEKAAGFWRDDHFVLRSTLDEDELIDWLTRSYCPSPVVNPWNGAGGFFFREDKATGLRDKETAATRNLAVIRKSRATRLTDLRRAIETSRQALDHFGLESAPSVVPKHALVLRLRDRLDDRAVAWLDAVLVVGQESLGFPPVLGTGGTEGALDFGSNFYQRLQDLMELDSGAPTPASGPLLRASLLGAAFDGRVGAAIGQFDPMSAGGGNAAPGFDGPSKVNPWDFVLLLEGTLLLASATTRKLERAEAGALAYPFSVRSVGADYASADFADEGDSSRHELWLPLWNQPASLAELKRLFGEGRAEVHGRRAVHAVDFARAVGTLGVDRGIDAFTRFGFHQRNGKSYLATPLGRWRVRSNANLELISARLSRWMDRVRGAARGNHAPASWARAAKRVERAAFALAKDENPRAVQNFLVALADAEITLGRTASGRQKVRPAPALKSAWLNAAADASHEHFLALSLASTEIRERWSPTRWQRGAPTWSKPEDHHRRVWVGQELVRALTDVVRRREIEANQESPRGDVVRSCPPPLESLRAFLDGAVDLPRLAELIRAYSLSAPAGIPHTSGHVWGAVPADYALCALAHHRIDPLAPRTDPPLHSTRGIVRSLSAGDGHTATLLADRRLKASGMLTGVGAIPMTAARAGRLAAALAFPFDRDSARAAYHAIRLLDPIDSKPTETRPSE